MLEMSELVVLLKCSGGQCAVTGITLRHDSVEQPRVKRPWAPSIDRIDSELGYSFKNCRIVCVAANIGMRQWGEEVLIEMARSIAKTRLRIGVKNAGPE
jgi:hypothetical protein